MQELLPLSDHYGPYRSGSNNFVCEALLFLRIVDLDEIVGPINKVEYEENERKSDSTGLVDVNGSHLVLQDPPF